MARAPLDLHLRCRCGHVRGVAREVSPSAGFRFVCYCKDCQAFAHFLDRTDVLDAAGGTDIFQMPPARVKITAGADAMRCLRFSGKVFRWYADCCRTPIANTAATPRFPFLGLIHSFMSARGGGRSRDEVIGPPLCRIYERSARGRFRRTRLRRRRSECSPAADRSCSAGGCAGSAGRARSSTIIPTRRSPRRACSRRASAPRFERLGRAARCQCGRARPGQLCTSGQPPSLSGLNACSAGIVARILK